MSINLTGWKPGEWKVFTVYNIHYDAYDLYFARKGFDGVIETATPAQFAKGPAAGDAATTGPWISAATGFGDRKGIMQAFLDEAWQCGYRPSGFADTTRQLSATQAHLNDMRAIVGNQLKVTL